MRYNFIKMLFAITIFITNSYAQNIKWHSNYNMTRYNAKKQNKNLFLYITTKDTNNPFSEYIDKDILTNPTIINYINQDYLAVKIDDCDNIPSIFHNVKIPSIYLLNGNGKNIHPTLVGDINEKILSRILSKLHKQKLKLLDK
jgi:thioredoxin-related protein